MGEAEFRTLKACEICPTTSFEISVALVMVIFVASTQQWPAMGSLTRFLAPSADSSAYTLGSSSGPSADGPPESLQVDRTLAVWATLDLLNGTLFPSSVLTQNGAALNGVAYDSRTGNLYVAAALSNELGVLNGSTGRLVGFIDVDPLPYRVAYDSGNGYLYVTAAGYRPDGPGTVTVVDGATDRIVTSIPVGVAPLGVAYDPENGYVYVANLGSGNLTVAGNVTVVDGATNRVIVSIPVGVGPGAIAYDSDNGYLYVANWGSANITVVDGATNHVVGSIPFEGLGPRDIAYDSDNRYLYATSRDKVVWVVNGRTNRVVASIWTGSEEMEAVAYNPGNGLVYVTNGGPWIGNVTVVDGRTNRVVGSIPVGVSPVGLAYDPANGYMYVTNRISENVSVIDGMKTAGSIAVGVAPSAIAHNPANGYVYVTDSASNTVTVVDGATNHIAGSIPVGVFPQGVAYDPVNGYMYVTNSFSDNVTVVDGATNQVVDSIRVGDYPIGLAHDASNGYLYVANFYSENVTVVDGATNRVVDWIPVPGSPRGVAYNPRNGYVYLTDSFFGSLTVIDGATDQVVGSIPLGTFPYALTYDPRNGYLYVTSGYSDTLIVVDGAANQVIGSIPVGPVPNAIAYDSANGYLYVTNSAQYRGALATYTVTVVDGATNRVVGSIPVGVYPDGVTFDSGNGYIYVTNLDSGSLSIIGPTPAVYHVTFSEVGLPAAAPWSVTLQGAAMSSTGSSIGFTEPNGTYDFAVGSVPGYIASPNSGKVMVSGSATSKLITFTPIPPTTYALTFTESGLPSGTSWSVRVGESEKSSTGGSIIFDEPNGTYAYEVESTQGYTASPKSGFAAVEGAAVTVTITFAAVTSLTYELTVTETGLPAGTRWSVTLNGTPRSSSTSSIVFAAMNGIYSFVVEQVAEFSVAPGSGTVVVAGHPVTKSVIFTASPRNPTILGLPVWEGFAVLAVAVVGLAGVIAVGVLRLRKRGGTPPRPPSSLSERVRP